MNTRLVLLVLSVSFVCFSLLGCETASIAIKEKIGIPKRDQMVARVKDARDSQQEVKQQFESALHEFMAVTGTGGGDLESKYDKLRKSYERSDSKAGEVRSRIGSVETVADKLFAEWNSELSQYSDPALRASSEQQLNATKAKYGDMLRAMKQAAAKMDPVLANLKDRVLFLKHNLNAQAIASLQTNVETLKGDVSRLIKEMEASISEANSFIDQMNK